MGWTVQKLPIRSHLQGDGSASPTEFAECVGDQGERRVMFTALRFKAPRHRLKHPGLAPTDRREFDEIAAAPTRRGRCLIRVALPDPPRVPSDVRFWHRPEPLLMVQIRLARPRCEVRP